MYSSSEEAMEDDDIISDAAARRELRRHGCSVIRSEGEKILVTNDCDEPEWVRCSPAAILAWLGY